MNGSFRKKPNGSVELRVWLDMPDGSHVQKSFCRRTRALAKAAYEEFLERGKQAQAHRQTVAGWGQEWLERKEKSVKYRTYANYELYFNHYILPALGKMQLSKLHQADIERMMGNAAHLSKSARHHIFITIDQIMKSAVINGLCSRNPCDGIKIKPDTTFKHIEVYKPEELTHIIAHLDRPFGTAIAILLYTGIRSEEIMGLRWNDIDQKNRTITIRRVVTRVAKGEFAPVETTKSDRIRVITYGDQLAAVLADAPKTSIYVVPAKRGGYMTPGSFRRQYDSFFDGLPIRRLSPHKLRHTYATYLIKGGAELRAVQTLLGHSSVKVTEIYTHVDTEDRRRAAEMLAY